MANPFDPGYIQPPPSPSGNLTPGIMQTLAATKPWVRFCSVLGFIGSGFMMLGGLMMMVSGFIVGASGRPNAGASTGVGIVGGVIYFIMAGLHLFPSIKLWKFGSAILNLMMSQSITHLDEAMNQQRGFWKFAGIMALIMVMIWLVSMGLMVVGGVATYSAMPTPTPVP